MPAATFYQSIAEFRDAIELNLFSPFAIILQYFPFRVVRLARSSSLFRSPGFPLPVLRHLFGSQALNVRPDEKVFRRTERTWNPSTGNCHAIGPHCNRI
jgi:hypothetical protein